MFGRPGCALNRPTWFPVKGSSATRLPPSAQLPLSDTIFLDPRNRHRPHLSATLLDRRAGNDWPRLLRRGRDRSGGGFRILYVQVFGRCNDEPATRLEPAETERPKYPEKSLPDNNR